MSPEFTFDHMRLCPVTGWGAVGAKTADKWLEFNHLHFDGVPRPLPIFFSQTSPYGNWVALCSCSDETRTICLCRPKETTHLRTDCGVLPHEMVHQHLVERGVSPEHAHQPWRDEITRLHLQITGSPLPVSSQKIIKVKQSDALARASACRPMRRA